MVIVYSVNRRHDYSSGLKHASVKMTLEWDTIGFRVIFDYRFDSFGHSMNYYE
jgi:hypothetical protein